MKKLFLGLLFLFFGVFVFWFVFLRDVHSLVPSIKHVTLTTILSVSPSFAASSSSEQKLLFVPYWTLANGTIDRSYDRLIYFGVGVNDSGLDTSDAGYQGIDIFFRKSSAQKNLLAIRMIDSNEDTKVLDSPEFQKKIITQSIALAKQKGFDGVVLDFEISALSFDSVVREISSFETDFASASHASNLSFYPMMFGDTFYQLRPFDVSTIGKVADGVIIMAYDFHKANGSPGPNFPFHAEDYDFQRMITDFLHKVPADKITVVFGMYGYDWKLDSKGQSVGTAKSYSDFEMKAKFLQSCMFQQCLAKRDRSSGEMKVTYLEDGISHEVWFEDVDSAKQKEQFLFSRGISAVGYWAWSYF